MPLSKHEYLSAAWADNLFVGKVVFCTGGNGSICSAQVRALVNLGADACIVGRNVEKTERVAQDIATARQGSKVIGIGGVDVRNVDDLQKSVDTCVKELGGIDFLIAGAAGNFLAPLSQLSTNAFKTIIDIDILGSYNITKLALPHLIASAKKHNASSSLPHTPTSGPGGRIVYVSATLHYTGSPLQGHVAVAKAGVDALSANVAIEYGPLGVTSNIIAPGPISGTEGVDRVIKNMPSTGRQIPLGRLGTVKEIADATVFLFSDAANYVTADSLVVDGGSWRITSNNPGSNFQYPDFLLSGKEVTGLAGSMRRKPGGDGRL